MRGAPTLSIKRGGTLLLQCQLQSLRVGVPVHGWQIDCWLRNSGGRQVAALAVAITDAATGRFELRATPEQTQGWPAGLLQADIRYQDSTGRVMHSTTFTLCVLDAVTTPA